MKRVVSPPTRAATASLLDSLGVVGGLDLADPRLFGGEEMVLAMAGDMASRHWTLPIAVENEVMAARHRASVSCGRLSG
jgi:hypothetical protein